VEDARFTTDFSCAPPRDLERHVAGVGDVEQARALTHEGALYVFFPDGACVVVCFTALTLNEQGLVTELTAFVLSGQLAAYGYATTLA
jgi:hypothetical protein